MAMNFRVVVKMDGDKPQAFEYKHVDGAMGFAQSKDLHDDAKFSKVTVSDLRDNKIIYMYAKRLLWDLTQ
jgi:hypothetical protein